MTSTSVTTNLVPPAWWCRLWQCIQREPQGQLLLMGLSGDAASLEALGAGGATPHDSVASLVAARGWAGPADALIVAGDAWAEAAVHLKPGGAFMVLLPAFPADVEAWRRQVETAFGATVHLVDPEPDTGWLMAFGWRSRQIPAGYRNVQMVVPRHDLTGAGPDTWWFESLRHLRDEGVLADVSLAMRLPPGRYDLIHLIGCTPAALQEKVQSCAVPVVVSPPAAPGSEPHAAACRLLQLLDRPDATEVRRALDALALQGLPAGEAAVASAADGAGPDVVDRAAAVVVTAPREGAAFAASDGRQGLPALVVPPAVTAPPILAADPQAFVEAYGVQDFVIAVGPVEPVANQLMLIHAMREARLPLVIVGRAADPDYLALCRRWAGPQVHFFDELPPPLLASAFAAARVHALPSWQSLPDSGSLAAALGGCGLVVGSPSGEADHFGDLAFSCRPHDYRDIQQAVWRAWNDVEPDRVQARRRHVLEHFTWAGHARAAKAAYEATLARQLGWFLIPDWARPETWQPAVLAYIQGYSPADRTLLQLYAGPLTGSDAETAFARVADLLEQAGEALDGIADIEIVDALPGNTSTMAIGNGVLAELVAEACAGRVISLAAWRERCRMHANQAQCRQREPVPGPEAGQDGHEGADSFRTGETAPVTESGPSSYADRFAGAARVLDVGCGPGPFLEALRARGIDGLGLDPDPAAVAACRARGLQAEVADVRRLPDWQEAFDGLHASHVIERLKGEQAIDFLEWCHRALRDQGLLVIRTANWANATVRHGQFWLELANVRPYPVPLLVQLLTDLGFVVSDSGAEPHGLNDLYVVARKMPDEDGP